MNTCVVISNPESIREENEIAVQLFQLGLQYYHLRKPGMSKDVMERHVLDIPEEYRSRVILHEHYDLVQKYNLKGIHITGKTKDKGFEDIYKDQHISISAHSFKELDELTPVYQYAFLGPVFNSISKQGYKSRISLEEAKMYFSNRKSKIPVLALGGVHQGNLEQLGEAGFSGFAVLGGIWNEYARTKNINHVKNIFLAMQDYINK